jgi:hypothetical protein
MENNILTIVRKVLTNYKDQMFIADTKIANAE